MINSGMPSAIASVELIAEEYKYYLKWVWLNEFATKYIKEQTLKLQGKAYLQLQLRNENSHAN